MRRANIAGLLFLGMVMLSGCTPSPWNNKAALQVITHEIPAEIFLDGQHLDKTPFISRNIKPGEYLLQIQPDDTRFVPYSTKVTLRPSILTVLAWKPGTSAEKSGGVLYEVEALTDRQKTKLTLVTIPDGGIIQVNGQARGFAPLTLDDLLPGEHQYQVSLPSYDSQQHSINLTQGYHTHVTLKLAKESAGDPLSVTTSQTVQAVDKQNEESIAVEDQQNTEESGAASNNPVETSTTRTGLSKARVKILPTGFRRDNQEGVRVREQPSSQAAETDFVRTGDEFPLLETNSAGWHRIQLETGSGWITGSFAQIIEE